jgi:hypothetical protein
MYGSSLMDEVYYFFIDLFRLEGLVRLSYTDKESRSILFNALFTVTYKYFFHSCARDTSTIGNLITKNGGIRTKCAHDEYTR